MEIGLALVLLAVFVAFLMSILRKKQQDARREYVNERLKESLTEFVMQDADEERKRKNLEKIKKIGIYQCDTSNLHLR
jgi:uncharacterized membrane protein (DUF106 family)